MKKAKTIYIVLSVLFFIAGIVLLIILATANLTAFNPLYTMFSGFTQLRYYGLWFILSISSFISAVCFFVIWVVTRFTSVSSRITGAFAIIIAVLFCITLSSASVNAYINYSEKGVYTDIAKDYEKPDEEYMAFFPYFDEITDSTNAVPYYSLNEYRLNDSVLRTSQVYSDIADENAKDVTITIDYFTSDKWYLMSKYESEKLLSENSDENGNAISSDNIVEKDYKGHECLIILLNSEKRVIIKDDDFYFSAIVQDDSNVLNLNESEFTSFAFEQFDLIANTDAFDDMQSF